jgi:hypothetical protein
MNAIQPSRPPLQQPIPKKRATPRPHRHLRQRAYRVMALETTVKIGFSIAISTAAISALVQLLPYHWTQQEKLRAVRTEVNQMESRVGKLQTELNRNFDPSQTSNIMQQQGYRFPPNQRKVLFIQPEKTDSE